MKSRILQFVLLFVLFLLGLATFNSCSGPSVSSDDSGTYIPANP